MLATRCPSCDAKIKFRDENRGKVLNCPGCKGKIDTGPDGVQVVAVGPRGPMPAAAGPVAGGGGGGGGIAGHVAAPQKVRAAGGSQMPQAVADCIKGALTGVCFGALLGLIVGLLAASFAADDGVPAVVMFVIVFGITAFMYTAAGAAIGLAYGLSGNEWIAYGFGAMVGLVLIVLGGGGWFGILVPVCFVIFTVRVLEFGD